MLTSDYIQEKAYAKVNLTFRVLGKLTKNYHSIDSVITFLPDLYDNIFIKKNSELTISIRGEFAKDLSNKGGDSIVKKVINLLKKKYNIKSNFNIILDKNIPLGAGLGGGSADAAAVTRLIFKMYKLNVSKKHIISHLSKVGADVPACYFSYNQKVEGFGDKLTKLRLLNKSIWALLIKPDVNLCTERVFKSFSEPYSIKPIYNYNYKNLICDINTYRNDLQKAAEKKSYIFKKLINNLPLTNDALTIPKMTGSGSAIFILFKNRKSAKKYSEKINLMTKGYWKKISKVIL